MLEGVSGAEEVADLGRLLGYLGAELAANRNFEFAQALLRLTLQARPAQARGACICQRAPAGRWRACLTPVVATERVARTVTADGRAGTWRGHRAGGQPAHSRCKRGAARAEHVGAIRSSAAGRAVHGGLLRQLAGIKQGA